MTDLTPEGDVTVEGHIVGRLKGLTFEPVLDARTLEGKAVRGRGRGCHPPDAASTPRPDCGGGVGCVHAG